jgi:protein-tyrosine-phosphatase
MNAKIENRLSMYRTVVSVCDKASAEIQTVPALWTNYQEFSNLVTELDDLIQLQMKQIGGITVDKQESRDALVTLMLNVSVIIKAYAADTGNAELYAAAHYTPSKLRRMRDEAMYQAAEIIYDLTDENAAELPPYGYTPVMLTDLADAIADYKDRVEDPDEARKMRKVYTKAIKNLDKRIRKMLSRRIDNGMKALGITEPMISEKYQSARVIYDYSSGRKREQIEESLAKSAFMGVVTDGEGLSVADAIVRIEGTTTNTLTDSDGEYLLEVPAGTWNIIVSKDGYTEVRDNTVEILAGETLEKDFTLESTASDAA